MSDDANPVKTLLLAALEKPPSERASFVERVCAGDADLRQHVEVLLRAHNERDSLLDQLAVARTTPAVAPDPATPVPVVMGGVRALLNNRPPVQLRRPDGETVVACEAVARPAELPPRYRLEGEIARGGMGCVLKGRDTDLGRDVAVKVLLETHAGRSELVQRFLEEAQIAGQLQHPGVTPVYELGQSGDNRPYFTMKLVHGHTLTQLLEQRTDPAQDRPRWLKVFEQVCQTLAYAHARGVIHRDLKPSNVMVGAFGEVQVMDWGLAKVLGQRRRSSSPSEPDRREQPGGSLEHTQPGAVLGTLGYMAPEQARGEVDRLDERCDVFGLGAILCQVLTGKPPYDGPPTQVFMQARLGHLAPTYLRLESSAADAELIALAKGCLAAQPEDRPRDAGTVAAAMTAYLESVEVRLRQAELARAAEQARAEEAQATARAADARARAERQARRLTLALGAAVLALVVVGGGGTAWYAQQRADRLARLDGLLHESELALDRDERADERTAPAEHEKARVALGQAEEVAATGTDTARADRLEALRERAAQGEKTRALLTALEAIRASRGEHQDNSWANAEYAAAFRAAGLDVDATTPAGVGAWVADRARSVELASYLDDWAEVRRRASGPEASWRRLVQAARLADPDPWRNRLRAHLEASKEEASQAVCTLADDDRALEAQPAVSLILLAAFLRDRAHDPGRAARVLRRAWTRFPSDFWVNVGLAWIMALDPILEPYRSPQWEEAVRHLSVAIAVRPRCYGVHNNLGVVLQRQGKLDEAAAAHREAIRLEPHRAWAYSNLGILLQQQGKFDEAIAAHRKATRLEPTLAPAHNNLGAALVAQKKVDQAIPCLREALRLLPDYPQARNTLAAALATQGDALRVQGKRGEALAAYREAIRLRPSHAGAQQNLGALLAEMGKWSAAVVALREAIRLRPDSADAHANLGLVLQNQGKVEEAITAFREAVRLNPRTPIRFKLGVALMSLYKLDEAIVALRSAIRQQPDDATAHTALGLVLREQGNIDQAVAMFRQAIRVKPDLVDAHYLLGSALQAQWKLDEALKAYRRAGELAPPGWARAQALTERARQVRQQMALAARLDAVLQGKDRPRNAAEGLALARLCHQRHRPAAAARLFAAAFAANARLARDLQAGDRYNAACAAALAAAGQGKDTGALSNQERLGLRRQALTWLRADLAGWTRRLGTGAPSDRAMAEKTMRHWQQNSELAGLRDADAVAKLPPEERQAWRTLWADGEALLRRAQQGTR
jgi:tetratricopeptide (TPR) repeat protein